MEYVRCECEACKQMIVLPGEVLVSECRCPGCGKPVTIPEHESTPFVHRMRGRLLATLAILAIIWLAWAIVSSFKTAPRELENATANAEPEPNAG